MGIFHTTYFFYGVHVPREKYVTDRQYRETEFLDGVIRTIPDRRNILGHVTAGDYDSDELFLCASPKDDDIETELGTFKVVQSHTRAMEVTEWDRLLAQLIEKAGYEGLDEPGWIVVPDAS